MSFKGSALSNSNCSGVTSCDSVTTTAVVVFVVFSVLSTAGSSCASGTDVVCSEICCIGAKSVLGGMAEEIGRPENEMVNEMEGYLSDFGN
jgi:hypothetical protein